MLLGQVSTQVVAETVSLEGELLFKGFGSNVAAGPFTVSEIIEPDGPLLLTWYVATNEAVLFALKLAIEHVVVPLLPAAGLLHVKTGPLSCWKETNVVLSGTVSVNTTFAEAFGP